MTYDFELVGKIGSMALIRREEADVDYNIFSRLGRELSPGMIWVTSGAAEIGRLDYIGRTGRELSISRVDAMTDYAAQGQTILMEQYRRYIRPEYSVRQVLVEHQHFNDPVKREHIRRLFLRARDQSAIRCPTRRTANGSCPSSDGNTARCMSASTTTRRRRSSALWYPHGCCSS